MALFTDRIVRVFDSPEDAQWSLTVLFQEPHLSWVLWGLLGGSGARPSKAFAGPGQRLGFTPKCAGKPLEGSEQGRNVTCLRFYRVPLAVKMTTGDQGGGRTPMVEAEGTAANLECKPSGSPFIPFSPPSLEVRGAHHCNAGIFLRTSWNSERSTCQVCLEHAK